MVAATKAKKLVDPAIDAVLNKMAGEDEAEPEEPKQAEPQPEPQPELIAESAKPKAEKPKVDADALALVGKQIEQRPVGFFTVNEAAAVLGLPADAGWYVVRALLLLNPDRFQETRKGHWQVRNGDNGDDGDDEPAS
jgi:hypothetical protein